MFASTTASLAGEAAMLAGVGNGMRYFVFAQWGCHLCQPAASEVAVSTCGVPWVCAYAVGACGIPWLRAVAVMDCGSCFCSP